MAQAVMSVILGRPDTARARPSSLIKDNTVYSQVFSDTHPIGMYSNAAALIRHVDRVLKTRTEMSGRDRSNLRFYVLFWLTRVLVGKTSLTTSDLAKINVKTVDNSDVEAAADEVWKIYDGFGRTDQIAKGPELRRRALEALNGNPIRTTSKTSPSSG